MLFISRILLLFLTLTVSGLAVLTACVIEREAHVRQTQRYSWADIVRGHQVVHGDWIHPARSRADKPAQVVLSQRDVKLAAHYLLRRVAHSGKINVTLETGKILAQATVTLPKNPFGRYLNAKLAIHQDTQAHAGIHSLSIGKLDLAPELASWLINAWILNPSVSDDYLVTIQSIRQLHISPNSIRFAYPDIDEIFPAMRTLVAADEQTLRVYQDRLTQLLGQPDFQRYPPLSKLLQTLFAFARQRSLKQNPIRENRALLLALNQAFNGDRIDSFLPGAHQNQASTLKASAKLKARVDLAQHFIGSAALAASSNAKTSNTIGIYKEFQDSYIGSGFSFIDLATDLAGSRFGEMAVKSKASARQLQTVMSQHAEDDVYMPSLHGLPEHLSTLEFNMHYALINSRRYKRLLRRVKERLSKCLLYQPYTLT